MLNQSDPNFLRAALQNTLNKKDVCMEFLIQPRTSNKMLVETSMNEWKEDKAPFIKLQPFIFSTGF